MKRWTPEALCIALNEVTMIEVDEANRGNPLAILNRPEPWKTKYKPRERKRHLRAAALFLARYGAPAGEPPKVEEPEVPKGSERVEVPR